MKQIELIYLAHPYSHPKAEERFNRFRSANKIAGILMESGLHVFSPISQSYPIAVVANIPGDWQYWKAYDEYIISFCKKLYVACVDGWDQSVGVAAEIEFAKSINIPISYIIESCDRLVVHHFPLFP